MKRIVLGWLAAAVLPLGAARADAPEFSSTIHGISVRPEIGTFSYGYELSGNLGGTTLASRTLEGRKYLLQWDAQAEAVVGDVAYEHPFHAFYGAQLVGQGDGGLRLMPSNDLSPYVGLGLQGRAYAINQAGANNLGDPAASNSLDGLAGLAGTLQLRLDGGASLLSGAHSLIVAAHLLAEMDSPLANIPALGFLGGGVHVRYDLSDSLVALGEFSYASTLALRDAALQASSRTGRWLLSGSAIKKLGAHVFLGLGIALKRSETDVSYTGGLTYRPSAQLDSRIWIVAGFAP